jgi:cyanophycinase
MSRIPALLFLGLFQVFNLFGQSQSGHLVIAGGGLEADNRSVYYQLIELSGGPDKATFAVIPSASGVPAQAWVSFSKILISYGVKAENIHLINISVMDDDSTTDVNESTWSENGKDPELAKIIYGCSAVWFTGGDQLRTMKALVLSDGKPTPVLQAVRNVYEKGGVIGGSSAGAAIMSEAMIGNGNSLGALSLPVSYDVEKDDNSGALLMSTGLGFFPAGIVDQHFNAKSRLGRLPVALMTTHGKFTKGFGVDENTAIIYSAKEKKFAVAGVAGVTIIDISAGEMMKTGNLVGLKNIGLSYLEEGDSYDIVSGRIIPGPDKKATVGHEKYDHAFHLSSGILAGNNPTFRDLLTTELIDNKGSDFAECISFGNSDYGFKVTFRKKPQSQGYYSEYHRDNGNYTVMDIQMDVVPVKLSVTPY